jgi:hypothetical protein
MELKDILSLALSALAVCWTAYTYIVHNKKLSVQQKQINEQQKQINDYQLRAMEEDEVNKKKAFIQCEKIPNSIKGKLDRIRIQNTGNSTANNVDFDIEDNQVSFNMSESLFPYPKLLPGQYVDIYYYSNSDKDHQTLVFTWDDAMQTGERNEQVVSL